MVFFVCKIGDSTFPKGRCSAIRYGLRGLNGRGLLIRFANEVIDHGRVLAGFAPCPPFRDVIFILELDDQMLLMTGSRVGKVSGALKLKLQFSRGLVLRYRAHPRLIVGRAVMHESDAVLVDAI